MPAPCLELEKPLHMSGTWSGWFKVTRTPDHEKPTTPDGHLQWIEQIDWSQVTLTLGALKWLPARGAYEPITVTLPSNLGDAAVVIHHQFNLRYISQDGLPDLRVTHHIKQVVDATPAVQHNEVEMFSGVCMAGS